MTYQSNDQSGSPVTELQTPLSVCFICELVQEVWHLEEPGDLASVVSED